MILVILVSSSDIEPTNFISMVVFANELFEAENNEKEKERKEEYVHITEIFPTCKIKIYIPKVFFDLSPSPVKNLQKVSIYIYSNLSQIFPMNKCYDFNALYDEIDFLPIL